MQEVVYCNRQCQQRHYHIHKHRCRQVARAAQKWVTLEGDQNGGPTREEVAAKCGVLERRRCLRDPDGKHWNLSWIDPERRGQGTEGKAETQECLKGLEEWGEEVLKTMRRAHASVECPGK